ncbi:hypothetical protein EI94DRAFT_1777831 [Lactarius quietus]|nr:hypothetical protein EI94DRAFT_1777831 [Lactarius quietus]
MPPLCFAYYCSGHGFGHATRVSAFARHILSLDESHTVHIVSSAPKRVFATSIALGAIYRNAEIDPVILQPLAYHVDRQKSIHVLKRFLDKKEQKVKEESQWLRDIKADCVLSDAAFLAFLAANNTRIPSVLITNFTFDSIYSLLSASFVDQCQSQHLLANLTNSTSQPLEPDIPIPEEILSPLVQQIFDGYRYADLLLPEVIEHLVHDTHTHTLHISIPFPSRHSDGLPIVKPISRKARLAPLLVRPPNEGIYTSEGRSRFLSSIGISRDLHDPVTTKILVVSFGGQTFHKPSRSNTPSRPASPNRPQPEHSREQNLQTESFSQELSHELNSLSRDHGPRKSGQHVFSPSHIFVPGAPAPAAMQSPSLPTFNTIPPTPTFSDREYPHGDTSAGQGDADPHSLMLPDASWIAVVCGVADSREWQTKRRGEASSANTSSEEEDGDLPEGFYIAPRDVYMPDLMAVGDVLLGKLGYGTVSECVDSCTPFVYVSRPLFVEEHGLRLLLDREGVGVEMTRDAYEMGEWASAVSDAWRAGAQRKLERREGMHAPDRRSQGLEMARDVVTWVNEWTTTMELDEQTQD